MGRSQHHFPIIGEAEGWSRRCFGFTTRAGRSINDQVANAGRRVTFGVAGWEERLGEWGESTRHGLLLDDGGLHTALQGRPT